jgi:hypothetical protein
MMYKVIEKKGDIIFCEDDKGKLHQRIMMRPIFPVTNGKMQYKHIQSIGNVDIKYNTNGVHGFTIFVGNSAVEDNIWELSKAVEVAENLRK